MPGGLNDLPHTLPALLTKVSSSSPCCSCSRKPLSHMQAHSSQNQVPGSMCIEILTNRVPRH